MARTSIRSGQGGPGGVAGSEALAGSDQQAVWKGRNPVQPQDADRDPSRPGNDFLIDKSGVDILPGRGLSGRRLLIEIPNRGGKDGPGSPQAWAPFTLNNQVQSASLGDGALEGAFPGLQGSAHASRGRRKEFHGVSLDSDREGRFGEETF